MESIGHSTLMDNFQKVTGSALDPGTFAGELLQRKLIGMAVFEEVSNPHKAKRERLSAIVMAVMKNGSPGGFKSFVEAVGKDESCEWLASTLRATYVMKGGIWDDRTTSNQQPPRTSAGLSVQCLQSRCSAWSTPKPDLRYLLRLPRVDWYNVGLQLDLDPDDLDTVEKNNRGDDKQARCDMYRLWLRRKGDASYQHLVDALRRAGEHSVVRVVCTKFSLMPTPSTPDGYLPQLSSQSSPEMAAPGYPSGGGVTAPAYPSGPAMAAPGFPSGVGMAAPGYPSTAYGQPPSLALSSLASHFHPLASFTYYPGYHQVPVGSFNPYVPGVMNSLMPGQQPLLTMQSTPAPPTATEGPCQEDMTEWLQSYPGARSQTPPPGPRSNPPKMNMRCVTPPTMCPSVNRTAKDEEPGDSDELSSLCATPFDGKGDAFVQDDGVTITTDDGKLKYDCFEPLPSSETKRLTALRLSFRSLVSIFRKEPQKENPYAMKKEPHGIAVIINNEVFVRQRERRGTDIDETNLIKTFRYLHYRVEVYRDCKSVEIVDILERVSQVDHSNFDSFVCCILSHGKEDKIYGSDSQVVELSSIAGNFDAGKCPSLAGKPKMFFIQACRGTKKEHPRRVQCDGEAGDTEPEPTPSLIEDDGSTVVIPQKADFLFSYATPYGQAAFRDCSNGSWYIAALCRTLGEFSTHLHLGDMLVRVNKQVGTSEEYDYEYRQAPEIVSRLTCNVYF